jgi:uncharacterized protein with PQ loop repeat
MFWILLVAVSVWLLSGVVVFLTILLGAWYQGRREDVEHHAAAETGAGRA